MTSKTRLSNFAFELPQELIAQIPIELRDHSRLLVLDRQTGEIQHKIFRDIADYLSEDDVLVLNETRVIPARLYGERVRGENRCKIELLLLRPIENTWEILIKPAKRIKLGDKLNLGEKLTGEVIGSVGEGSFIVEFNLQSTDLRAELERIGETPLPPYIKRPADLARYQTIFASEEEKQACSAAAPTAGLHFTPELLQNLQNKGVCIEKVTLHVGLGTFAPIRTKYIEDHKIHSEYYEVPPDVYKRLKRYKQQNKNIVAVGTTSVRVLETVGVNGRSPLYGETNIYITPGYKFNFVDKLITNFHLPDSSLILLVAAFAGHDKIKAAYQEAIKQKYRFYSFGDAMLITNPLPPAPSPLSGKGGA